MFSTVIVPLDGSLHAEAAVPYAVDEARRHGARLVLVRVVVRPETCSTDARRSGPAPTTIPRSEPEIDLESRGAAHYLADTIERYGLGRDVRGSVLVGDPTHCVMNEAGRYDQPVIVLTTGDVTDGAKPPLSEVARRLMIAGTVPVLGVRLPPTVGADVHGSLPGKRLDSTGPTA